MGIYENDTIETRTDEFEGKIVSFNAFLLPVQGKMSYSFAGVTVKNTDELLVALN